MLMGLMLAEVNVGMKQSHLRWIYTTQNTPATPRDCVTEVMLAVPDRDALKFLSSRDGLSRSPTIPKRSFGMGIMSSVTQAS